MKLIALTGGIACGQSTVASEIAKHPNVVIIDADQIARSVWNTDTVPYQKLKQFFKTDPTYQKYDSEMFLSTIETTTLDERDDDDNDSTSDKTQNDTGDNASQKSNINRPLLGQLTFEHADLRRVVNSYSHQWIFNQIIESIWNEWKTSSSGDNKVVVLDMPLFFETKVFSYVVSKVIVVTTDRDTQKQFLMQRNQLSEQEAEQRINSQMPNHIKEQRADFVIRNTSDLEHLRIQANEKFLECVNAASDLGWSTLKMAGIIAAASLSMFYAYAHYWSSN